MLNDFILRYILSFIPNEKKKRERASFDEDRFKDHNMVNAADPFIVSHLVRKAKTRIHF